MRKGYRFVDLVFGDQSVRHCKQSRVLNASAQGKDKSTDTIAGYSHHEHSKRVYDTTPHIHHFLTFFKIFLIKNIFN